jgi:hypothetical protein
MPHLRQRDLEGLNVITKIEQFTKSFVTSGAVILGPQPGTVAHHRMLASSEDAGVGLWWIADLIACMDFDADRMMFEVPQYL